MNNPKVILNVLLLLISISLVSCHEEEVIEPVVEIEDPVSELVKSLNIFYYGKEIPIWEASKTIVGTDGEVEYKIYQANENDGTDFVNVDFKLLGGASCQFGCVDFKLMVDMKDQGVEIKEAYRDQQPLSDMNLILLLGNY